MSAAPGSAWATTLTAEVWQRLEELLDRALELPEAEREGFLDRVCDDGAARRELASLLAAHEETEGPLERLARALHPEPPGGLAELPAVGDRVGAYQLVEVVGRGGMGVVYRARRADGEYRQDVALKLISSPLPDAAARRRFLAERQILALISHPNVARLLDGGVTATGHPFFTMEIVRGLPLDRYCDGLRLDVEHRLRLFLTVCDAVSAVHQNLVVHRDLKPSNILVTTGEGSDPPGVVKLLDFGIAKLLEAPGEPFGRTATGVQAFTPDYASPEQVQRAAITTASDVYSLGAVLYGLLTGVKAHRFESDAPSSIHRVICDRDPPRPSAALEEPAGGLGSESLEASCRGRRTRPERLRRRLQGDLDTIVLKALHKDPRRRYPSVGELRDDLSRHLEGRPVKARPDAWSYRCGKFLRRRRSAVAATALVGLALTAGWITTSIQAQRAQRQERLAAQQRDRAQEEAARAARVTGLLKDVFRLADPEHQPGETVTARQLLEEGARRIESALEDDPETRAEMLEVVGELYHNLALIPPAAEALERSLELRRTLPGAAGEELSRTLYLLGRVRFDQSRYPEAESLFEEALAMPEADRETRAAALHGLGLVRAHTGRPEGGERALRQALEILEGPPRGAPGDHMEALLDLAVLLHRRGGSREAGELFREAVEIGRGRRGMSLIEVRSLLQLAQTVHQLDGGLADAEPLYREALAAARSLFSGDHSQVASCLNGLSRVLRDLGRYREAEGPARESLAMWRRLYPEPHREVSIARLTLARLLQDLRRFEEAEELMRLELGNRRQLYGEPSTELMVATSTLAGLLEDSGQPRRAEPLRRQALAMSRQLYPGDHAMVVRSLTFLARNLLPSRSPEEAEVLLREALVQRQRLHAGGHWRLDAAKVELGLALIATGKLSEAETLLSTAHGDLVRSRGEGSPEARAAADGLARLEAAGKDTRNGLGRRQTTAPGPRRKSPSASPALPLVGRSPWKLLPPPRTTTAPPAGRSPLGRGPGWP